MSITNEYKANNTGRIIWKVIAYLLLTLFALFMLFPFYFMILTSFVDNVDFQKQATEGHIIIVPQADWLTIQNYLLTFQAGQNTPGSHSGFGIYFLNTFIVAIVSTFVTVVTTLFAAFAFSRLEFKGKNLLFMLILATMMVPGEMMVLTNYQTTASFGWLNTFSALILVHGVAVFYIFYLRQTFQQIPNELYLASKVDGYTDTQYFWKIMVPLAAPTVITITILSVMGAWNSFIWPTLVASGENLFFKAMGINWNMKLVSNGIMSMFATEFSDNIPGRLAGSVLTTLPLLVIFAIFRKRIMTGVSRSGIKG